MQYEKINMGSYNLHFIKTDKFKTVTVSVNFRRPVVKEEITIRKFLFSILCDSTKKLQTRRLLRIEQENLYLLNLVHGVQIFGNYVNSFIDIRFLNDNFSEEGNVSKSLGLLFDILFNPNIVNNTFNEESFKNIKSRADSDIRSVKDNTGLYGLIKALEGMDSSNPASFHTWGYLDDLNSINNDNLYKYYNSVLTSDLIDIFLVGNIDIEDTKKLFRDNFLVNTIKRQKIDIFINYNDYRKRIKKIMIEEKLLVQSKLSIVFKIINITDFERRYVFPIYADILGGSAYSRLFQNVREKNSLAYSISASTKSPASIMLVSSGIEKEKFEKALKIIKKEVKGMTSKILDTELDNAKNDILTNIKSIDDNPSDIINYHLGMEVLNSDNIENKIKNFNKVTIEDVMKFASKVKMDTVLLLYGSDDDEKTRD